MKSLVKFLLIPCLFAAAFLACEDKHDVVKPGMSGSSVEGTEVSMEYPDGEAIEYIETVPEEGMVRTITLTTSEPVKQDVTVVFSTTNETTLTAYNEANGTEFRLCPSQYYSVAQKSTTIKKGESSADLEITFKGLDASIMDSEDTFAIPVTLTDISQGSKIGAENTSYIFVLELTPRDVVYFDNGGDVTFSFSENIPVGGLTKTLSIKSDDPLARDLIIYPATDTKLLTEYGETTGRSYKILPEDFYVLRTGNMSEGSTEGTIEIEFRKTLTEDMIDESSYYALPITISRISYGGKADPEKSSFIYTFDLPKALFLNDLKADRAEPITDSPNTGTVYATRTLAVKAMDIPIAYNATMKIEVDPSLLTGTAYTILPDTYYRLSGNDVTFNTGDLSSSEITLTIDQLPDEYLYSNTDVYAIPVKITEFTPSDARISEPAKTKIFVINQMASEPRSVYGVSRCVVWLPLKEKHIIAPTDKTYEGDEATYTRSEAITLELYTSSSNFGGTNMGVLAVRNRNVAAANLFNCIGISSSLSKFSAWAGATANGDAITYTPQWTTSKNNVWMHVALVVEPHTSDPSLYQTTLYVNGVSVGDRTFDKSKMDVMIREDQGVAFAAGRFSASAAPSHQYVRGAEIRVWSEARSINDIRTYMNDLPDSERNKSTLLGYWKFDEGTGLPKESRGIAGFGDPSIGLKHTSGSNVGQQWSKDKVVGPRQTF